MRISQNSSAFYDVRRVIACATKIENCRIQREAFGARQCPLSANGGSLRCAALGEVEETVFASLSRQQRSSSTTNCSFFPLLRQRC
jgi:hypothetical protein